MPELPQFASAALTVASIATVIAALAHFACIAIGASAYRVMGAGTPAVEAIERGELRPHVAALVVGSVLLVLAAYALSGAGIFPPFPLLRWVLGAFSLALLARAFLFPLLRPRFPGNSPVFWLVSSTACLMLGCLYLVGALFAGV
jgi:hypothetical protein